MASSNLNPWNDMIVVPKNKLIEVEHNGNIFEVQLIINDGWKPHWANKDRTECWEIDIFKKWRLKDD